MANQESVLLVGTISTIRYDHDRVLIAENESDLQELLNVMEKESRKKGLELKSKKTEVMVISRKKETPICELDANRARPIQCPILNTWELEMQHMDKATQKLHRQSLKQNITED